ncbi:MAG: hypothetical protein D6718_08025 [Acidobacteria bacterium]|nr:MAG: hypothetical protein D6718_08025 [Acidobacteriota bacterium]
MGGDRPRDGTVRRVRIAVLFTAALACAACERRPDPGRLRAALEAGRAAEVAELFLRRPPGDAREWRIAAEAFARTPDLAEEGAELLAPAAERASDPEVVLLAARVAEAADRLGDALRWLESGEKRHPRVTELRIERAKLLARLGRAEEALGLLEPIAGADPRLLNLAGYCALLDGQRAKARALLERSEEEARRRAGRDYAPALYHLGLLAMAEGNRESAIERFRAAAAANPRHLEAHYQWMAVAERLGRSGEAERARRRFGELARARLAQLGALDDEPPEAAPPPPVDRSASVEERRVVEEVRFTRTLPAGAPVTCALLVPAGGRSRFRVTVAGGPERGRVLLDLLPAGAAEGAYWVEQRIETPRAEGTRVDLRFEVLPAGPVRSLLARFGLASAPEGRFAEPRALTPADRRSSDPRPNILLVSLDTLRADRLGAYGWARPTSPAIDRLAAGGVLFERAEAASNWTLPSHYSLFSGLTPAAHGVLPDLGAVRGYLFPDRRLAVRGSGKERMLAEVLEEAGYRTVAVTEDGWVSARFGFDQGFEVYRSARRGGLPFTAEAALAELRFEGANGPWFLFVHTYTTHQPYHAPRRYRTRWADPGHVGFAWPAARVPISDYNRFHTGLFPPAPSDVRAFRDLYDGQVAWADTLVDRLVRWLADNGLLEQTVVAVVSDHGEEIFERGRFDHGETLYEEVTRVPLVLYAPGRLPAGRRVRGPVSLVDLPATLLEFAGAEGRLGQGRSLLPRIEGGAASRPAFAEALAPGGVPLAAVWSGSLKYIRRGEGPAAVEELYDLASDPLEQRNLAQGRPGETARLRALLDRHLAASARVAKELGEGKGEVDEATRERLRSLGYVE